MRRATGLGWLFPLLASRPTKASIRNKKGGGWSSAFKTILNRSQLLGAQDCVLGGLGDAEFHHALGGNVNLRASSRIAADARFPVYQHQFAQARNREAVLRVLVCERHDGLQNFAGLLFC